SNREGTGADSRGSGDGDGYGQGNRRTSRLDGCDYSRAGEGHARGPQEVGSGNDRTHHRSLRSRMHIDAGDDGSGHGPRYREDHASGTVGRAPRGRDGESLGSRNRRPGYRNRYVYGGGRGGIDDGGHGRVRECHGGGSGQIRSVDYGRDGRAPRGGRSDARERNYRWRRRRRSHQAGPQLGLMAGGVIGDHGIVRDGPQENVFLAVGSQDRKSTRLN